ncbi:MAG: DUF5063 domain-containing protein [Planctomycetota bacterium]
MSDFRRAAHDLIELVDRGPRRDGDPLADLTAALDRLAQAAATAEAYMGPSNLDPPSPQYEEVRRRVVRSFPQLGYYNIPAMICDSIAQTEIHVGDAVDELADIVRDLEDALWCLAEGGPAEGTLQFDFGYHCHWGEHLANLRWYLFALRRSIEAAEP